MHRTLIDYLFQVPISALGITIAIQLRVGDSRNLTFSISHCHIPDDCRDS
jgi:hypothetical protein